MLTSSFPAVLVDVAAKPKELSASQLGQLEKTRQKLGLNKIEGTPILKLAMVKRS